MKTSRKIGKKSCDIQDRQEKTPVNTYPNHPSRQIDRKLPFARIASVACLKGERKMLKLYLSFNIIVFSFLSRSVSVDSIRNRYSSFAIMSAKPCQNAIGQVGTCMFMWDCIKTEGLHLGTCSDRFLFGSCCYHNVTSNDIDIQLASSSNLTQSSNSSTPSISPWQSASQPSPETSNVVQSSSPSFSNHDNQSAVAKNKPAQHFSTFVNAIPQANQAVNQIMANKTNPGQSNPSYQFSATEKPSTDSLWIHSNGHPATVPNTSFYPSMLAHHKQPPTSSSTPASTSTTTSTTTTTTTTTTSTTSSTTTSTTTTPSPIAFTYPSVGSDQSGGLSQSIASSQDQSLIPTSAFHQTTQMSIPPTAANFHPSQNQQNQQTSDNQFFPGQQTQIQRPHGSWLTRPGQLLANAIFHTFRPFPSYLNQNRQRPTHKPSSFLSAYRPSHIRPFASNQLNYLQQVRPTNGDPIQQMDSDNRLGSHVDRLPNSTTSIGETLASQSSTDNSDHHIVNPSITTDLDPKDSQKLQILHQFGDTNKIDHKQNHYEILNASNSAGSSQTGSSPTFDQSDSAYIGASQTQSSLSFFNEQSDNHVKNPTNSSSINHSSPYPISQQIVAPTTANLTPSVISEPNNNAISFQISNSVNHYEPSRLPITNADYQHPSDEKPIVFMEQHLSSPQNGSSPELNNSNYSSNFQLAHTTPSSGYSNQYQQNLAPHGSSGPTVDEIPGLFVNNSTHSASISSSSEDSHTRPNSQSIYGGQVSENQSRQSESYDTSYNTIV